MMIYLNLFVAIFLGYRLINVDYHNNLSKNIHGIFFAWNLAEIMLYVDKIVQSIP